MAHGQTNTVLLIRHGLLHDSNNIFLLHDILQVCNILIYTEVALDHSSTIKQDMAGLESLAQETVEAILVLLPLHDIASLARTSKALRICVTPTIYRNIHLDWRKPIGYCVEQGYDHLDSCPCEEAQHCDYWSHPRWCDKMWTRSLRSPCLVTRDCSKTSLPSLYLLFRTIIATRNLASHVRSLHLGGNVPRSVWTTSEQTQLTCQEQSRVRLLLESGPRLWVDSWLRELDKGTPDAFAGVLLLCLPNLEVLQIGLGFQQPASCIGVLLRISILFGSLSPKLLPDCNNLKGVEMGLNEEIVARPGKPPMCRASEYDQHLPLFYLPSIRRLSIVMPDLSASHKFTWPAETPTALSLETLELPFTHFPEDDLTHLLEASPNLKTLKYDFWALGFEHYCEQHDGTIDLAKLERSLTKVSNTLQVFHLQFAFREWPPTWGNPYVRNRISFSTFSAIRALHVPLVALLGPPTQGYPHTPVGSIQRLQRLSQALPGTLEHLCLNDDDDDPWDANWDESYESGVKRYDDDQMIQILAEYLGEYHLFTPRLRTIRLLTYHWLRLGADERRRSEDLPPDFYDVDNVHRLVPVIRDKEALEDALLPLCNAANINFSVTLVRYRGHKWRNRTHPWRPAYFDVFDGLEVE